MRRRTAFVPALALALAVAQAIPAVAFGQNPPEAKKDVGPADYPGGLIHTVVGGDTLWDLSAKYLGSPWKWPELWERNRFLTNPHYLYPGIQVVVFPPPVKEYPFAGKKEAVPESPAAPPAPEPAKETAAAPPPAAVAPAAPPVLDIKPLDYVCGGEFLREKPAGIGFIRNAYEPKIAFSESDRLYLTLTKDIPAGQLLAVYRVRGPIAVPGKGSLSGYVKYLVGILQVTGKTEGKTTATVRTSFEDLTTADVVSEEIPGYAPVIINPGAEGLETVIIAGRSEKVELSAGDFLYFDKGTAAGIAVGNVFRVIDGRLQSTPGSGDPAAARVEVGRAVVIRSTAEFSTGYVVKSLQSFSAGVPARRGVAETP